MKKLIVSVLSSLVLVSGGVALAAKQAPVEDKLVRVDVCHRTESESNSWVVIEVSKAAADKLLEKGDMLYQGPFDAKNSDAKLWCGVGIDKQVKDVTTGSAYVDANDQASALAVNPGDVLSYKITVKGSPSYLNRLELDDLLPAGTTPSDVKNAHIDGKAQSTTFDVIVTATSGFVTNTACLNLEEEQVRTLDVAPLGEKTDKNDVSVKCDSAVVSVTPVVIPSPSVSPTPTPTPVVTTVTILPVTGGSGRTRP